MDIDIPWHIEAHELRSKMSSAVNNFGGNDAITDNFLVVIDIVQEEVQCSDPLTQTALHVFPFRAGDDARNQVERKYPFGPFQIVVNCKGDPLREKCVVC